MRTQGDDESLGAGLLYGEGIVDHPDDIEEVESSTRRPNGVNVRLRPEVRMEMQTATRRFSAGSSGGARGTDRLDAAISLPPAIRHARRRATRPLLLFGPPSRIR